MNKLPPAFYLVAFWVFVTFYNPSQSIGTTVQQEMLNSALVKAVEANQAKEVRMLLRNGASANSKSKDNEAILKVAARFASSKITRMLLWRGANVNAKSGVYQGTALIYAAGRGNISIVKLLLKWGADINDQDGNGWTALSSAEDNRHYSVAKLLKKAGAKGATQERMKK